MITGVLWAANFLVIKFSNIFIEDYCISTVNFGLQIQRDGGDGGADIHQKKGAYLI